MTEWNNNRLTATLGIAYPIIQGPLGGLSSQRLTAAVSNFGGLGSFGAHSLAPDRIRDVIAQVRSLTTRPFAMNLWVSMEDDGARTSDERAFNRCLAPLAAHLAELGAPRPEYKAYVPARFEDQARVVLDAGVPAFSFIFGIPPREVLDECRRKRIVTIGTATSLEEAAALDEAGVDAIVASGFEAGGHRGSFLRPAEDSLVGTMSLVPRVVDAAGVPVIAAGGIGDARGVVAALALGAEGVQMGTVFLACEESGAGRLHREALLGPDARAHRPDERLHRKAGTGTPEPPDGGVEPQRERVPALSAATRLDQEPFDRRGGGGSLGPAPALGRAERRPLPLQRRSGVPGSIGRGSRRHRRPRRAVERTSPSEAFHGCIHRRRTATIAAATMS